MKRIKALSLAQNLLEELAPSCERIQIAGSLRRGKREVKDIEIVCIPIIKEKNVVDLFGDIIEVNKISILDNLLEAQMSSWQIDTKTKRWGPRYKRIRHIETGICCDLFITDKIRWGYQITIRTGPWKFSKAIVTLALHRGWHFSDSLLHKHTKHNNKACERMAACPFVEFAREEKDIFKVLGLPWCEPAERTAEWLWEVRRKRVVT